MIGILCRLSKNNLYLCIVQVLTDAIFMNEIIKPISMAICTLLYCAFHKVTSLLTCKSHSAFSFCKRNPNKSVTDKKLNNHIYLHKNLQLLK